MFLIAVFAFCLHWQLTQSEKMKYGIVMLVRCGSNISWLNNLFQYILSWFSNKFIDATLNTFKTVYIYFLNIKSIYTRP